MRKMVTGVHESLQASELKTEAETVSAILEAIPTNFSATPAVTSLGQSSIIQGGSGGFAAALAAAQGSTAVSSPSTGAQTNSAENAAGSAAASAGVWWVGGAPISPGKKGANGTPAPQVAVGNPAPVMLAANPAQWSAVPANSLPVASAFPALNSASIAGVRLPSPDVGVSGSDRARASVGFGFVAGNTASFGPVLSGHFAGSPSISAPSAAVETSTATTSTTNFFGLTSSSATDATAPALRDVPALKPSPSAPPEQDTPSNPVSLFAPAAVVVPSTTSSGEMPLPLAATQAPVAEALPAIEASSSSLISAAIAQPSGATVPPLEPLSPDAASTNVWSESSTAEPVASNPGESPLLPATPALVGTQTAELIPPPVLGAEPILEVAASARAAVPGIPAVQSVSEAASAGVAEVAEMPAVEADAPDASALAANLGPQNGGFTNAAVPTSDAPQSVLAISAPLPAKADTPMAGEQADPAKASETARAMVPANAMSAISASNAGHTATASQTPFQVYFSGPTSSSGPSQPSSTESAAAILPRMILPKTSAAASPNIANATAGMQLGGLAANAVPGVSPQAAQSAAQGGVGQRKDASQPSSASGAAASVSSPSSGSASAYSAPGAGSPATSPAVAPPLPAPAPVISAGIAPQAPADRGPKQIAPPVANSEAGSTPAVPQALPAAAPGPVQLAQMASKAGQSEMRIGMNTSAFGSVEVRTVVHSSDVGLTIGSEKGDLRGLLTNEMPALSNTLQQQNLRLNSISFTQGFASPNNNSSGGGAQEQRSFVPQPSAPAESFGMAAAAGDAVETATAAEFGYGQGSLSILA